MSLPPDPVTLIRNNPTDGDPRGILFCWEPPKPSETYVIGCDPTVGIEGWCRELRVKDDLKTDNCAIEILRLGKFGDPDVQVAEYAGPISPYQQAALLSHLGRKYRGSSESGEALIVLEVWPGPGTAVIQPLVHIHGYTNFWNMEYLDQIYPSTRNINKWPGWYSNQRSLRDLWLRANHFVSINIDDPKQKEERRRDENGILIRSPWLIDEMGDCEINPSKMRIMAVTGRHEDRWMGLSLALWGGHSWSSSPIPDATEAPIRRVDWQASDISYETMMDQWNQRFEELTEV